MTLTFYNDPNSPPSRAVQVFLMANNIQYDAVEINLLKGEQRTGDYEKITPMKKVPVIDHDGLILTQSGAILQYLVNALPNIKDHWYPSDVKVRAKVDEYMMWHQSMGFRPIGLFRQYILPLATHKISAEQLDMNGLSKCKESLEQSLSHLENYFLKNRDYIAGDQISIADCMAVTDVMQNAAVGFPVTRDHPGIDAWISRCKSQIPLDVVHEPIMKLSKPYRINFN